MDLERIQITGTVLLENKQIIQNSCILIIVLFVLNRFRKRFRLFLVCQSEMTFTLVNEWMVFWCQVVCVSNTCKSAQTESFLIERMNDVVLIFARLERHLTSSGARTCRLLPGTTAPSRSRQRSPVLHVTWSLDIILRVCFIL